jgi:hypothetical protein
MRFCVWVTFRAASLAEAPAGPRTASCILCAADV